MWAAWAVVALLPLAETLYERTTLCGDCLTNAKDYREAIGFGVLIGAGIRGGCAFPGGNGGNLPGFITWFVAALRTGSWALHTTRPVRHVLCMQRVVCVPLVTWNLIVAISHVR